MTGILDFMKKYGLTERLIKDLAHSLYSSGQAYGDKISFSGMEKEYPPEVLKKIVLIHSGYALSNHDGKTIRKDAMFLKNRGMFEGLERNYRAFFSKHLSDAAGEDKKRRSPKRPYAYLSLKNECYHTFYFWRMLGLGEEELKEMLNKLAKARIGNEEGRLSDKLQEISVVLKNAKYSSEILSPELVNYLTDLTVGDLSEEANIRDFLDVLDLFGEERIETNKKMQEKLLEGAKSYTEEDSWSPQNAFRIYDFMEKKGDLDHGRKALKGKIEKYLSKPNSKLLKRKIQRMTRKLK